MAGVPLADRVLLVEFGVDAGREEPFDDLPTFFRHAVFFHERQYRHLDRRQARVQTQYRAFALAFRVRRFFVVGVAEEREHAAGGSGCRLDHVRHVVPALFAGFRIRGFRVEIGQFFARTCRVRLEIVIRARGDAFELAPAPGEEVFDVVTAVGIMGQLVRRVRTQTQVIAFEADRLPPADTFVLPKIEVFHAFTRRHEIFHLHLFELDRTENEVFDRHLVAETFADLRDAERHLHAGRLQHVRKLHEHRLRRFRPQVYRRFGQRRFGRGAGVGAFTHGLFDRRHHVAHRIDRTEEGAEHQVEFAFVRHVGRAAVRAHVAAAAGFGAADVFAVAREGDLRLEGLQLLERHPRPLLVGQANLRRRPVLGRRRFVGAEPFAADLAVDQRIREVGEVAGGTPDLRVHHDRRVDADDVFAAVHHAAPPLGVQVALQLDAHRTEVVGGAQAAVDFRAGVNEASPLAERDDFLHLSFAAHGRLLS